MSTALHFLFPAPNRGWIAETQEFFQHQVQRKTVHNWCVGTRKAPQWALALTLQALDRQIAHLEHIRTILLAVIKS